MYDKYIYRFLLDLNLRRGPRLSMNLWKCRQLFYHWSLLRNCSLFCCHQRALLAPDLLDCKADGCCSWGWYPGWTCNPRRKLRSCCRKFDRPCCSQWKTSWRGRRRCVTAEKKTFNMLSYFWIDRIGRNFVIWSQQKVGMLSLQACYLFVFLGPWIGNICN